MHAAVSTLQADQCSSPRAPSQRVRYDEADDDIIGLLVQVKTWH